MIVSVLLALVTMASANDWDHLANAPPLLTWCIMTTHSTLSQAWENHGSLARIRREYSTGEVCQGCGSERGHGGTGCSIYRLEDPEMKELHNAL